MSVTKRANGQYTVRIETDRATDGSRKRRTIGTFRTKTEAQRAEREALAAKDRGIDLSPSTVTVEQLLEQYLLDASSRCGEKTLERYREIAAQHISARLGSRTLAKLRAPHVSEWVATLLNRGGRNNRPLSPKSVRHSFGLLNAALRFAIRMQLIDRNVCEAVRPPSVPRSEAKALTREEIGRLMQAASGTRWEAFVSLALASGARRGELCALTWQDIDLTSNVVTISKSLSQTKSGLIVKSPKNGKSRKLPLSQFAADALRRQKAMQAKEKLAAGGAYEDFGLVFADELGRRITPMAATCAFERVATKANISTTRLHDTRHTAATMLLVSGVDIRTVSSIIGHANASTTLNIYSHVLPNTQHAAVDLLGDRLEEAKRGA
jgi:integrase